MTKEDFLINLYGKSGIATDFRFGRDEIVKEFDIGKNALDKFANYCVDEESLLGPSQTTAGSHLTLFFNSSGIDHVKDLMKNQNQTY